MYWTTWHPALSKSCRKILQNLTCVFPRLLKSQFSKHFLLSIFSSFKQAITYLKAETRRPYWTTWHPSAALRSGKKIHKLSSFFQRRNTKLYFTFQLLSLYIPPEKPQHFISASIPVPTQYQKFSGYFIYSKVALAEPSAYDPPNKHDYKPATKY